MRKPPHRTWIDGKLGNTRIGRRGVDTNKHQTTAIRHARLSVPRVHERSLRNGPGTSEPEGRGQVNRDKRPERNVYLDDSDIHKWRIRSAVFQINQFRLVVIETKDDKCIITFYQYARSSRTIGFLPIIRFIFNVNGTLDRNRMTNKRPIIITLPVITTGL